jgi:hypothetical protein
MIDEQKLRDFAQEYIKAETDVIAACGMAGGNPEVTRAEVARKLLALIDGERCDECDPSFSCFAVPATCRKLPMPTSPDRIPPAIRASLDLYATEVRIRPGHCVSAILAGDLYGAFARADPETRDAMPAIVAYIHSQLPAACHGSEDAVDRWIARLR